MLVEPPLINKLPTYIQEQLELVGDFYICKNFTGDYIGEPIVSIGENIYYRFMDFIYLPQKPESLNSDQIIEICDLRLLHMGELVKPHLNEHIVEKIVAHTTFPSFDTLQPLRALDFGCGSGFSMRLLKNHIPNMDIIGADISEKAVKGCIEHGLTAYHTAPIGPLPFKDNEFDLIFAIFVMHFSIDLSTLVDLVRILRPSGKFLFNVYQRDINSIVQQLQEAGFCSITVWYDLAGLSASHKIVSCSTASPCETVFISEA